MTELIRVASLSGYVETLGQLGLDPRPFLAEQGLPKDLFANPGQLIPARAAIRLLERAATVSGCVTLGLRMAEGRAIANLGVASLLIAHQPTLRHALAAIGEFRARINSTLVLHIESIGDDTILREDFTLSRPEPMRQSDNLALAVLTRLCEGALGAQWTPQAACFSHAGPPAAELAVFHRIFRCPLQFDSEFNCIVVRTADLDRPSARADDQLAQHARQLLDAVMHPAERGARADVDQLIRLLLPAGRATVQTCAASMGVTVRSLQRMLDAEGVSFTGLLNQARMQLATQYLANPRMRITDIADMLGYGSIGAFTRWHCQAFGRTPSAARADQ